MLRGLLILGCLLGAPDAVALSPGAAAIIEQTVEAIRSDGAVDVGGATIASTVVLPRMYEQRGFQLLWRNAAAVEDLLGAIHESARDGLEPADYHLAAIERLRGARPDEAPRAADLDLLLTDALVQLAYHSRFGKVDPRQLDANWNFAPALRAGDPAVALLAVIDAGDIAAFIRGLAPQQPFYQRLRTALEAYRRILAQGGWPVVAAGPSLRPGETSARVPVLRQRLARSADLPADTARAEGEQYDAALVEAVQVFQNRHGLDPDGVVGRRTLHELNVPAGARIGQIRAALERSRWVMNDLPERFVVVNVAGFRVYLLDHGDEKWTSRVIVGKPYTRTPIFRADMTYVVLNPAWTVPASIVRKEIRPGMQRDPHYLEKKGLQEIDGRFVQPPGERNALGRIKLMFPNPHAVYLHDTPSKSFFGETRRTFSHGCVRVEKAVELAALVLADSEWTVPLLEAAIATGKTQTVLLKQPVPVLILYWTAAVGADGRVEFRPDIYGRDAAVLRALGAPWAPRRHR